MARGLARPRGSELLRSLGLAAELDVATDPFFGRARPDARPQPARAGAEVRAARPDRRPRAHGDRVLQLPPGPLRVDLRDRDWPTGEPPTRPASASATSGSCWRCCARHGLDPDGWPREVRGGAVAPMTVSTVRELTSLSGIDPAGVRAATRCTPRAAPTRRPTATRTSSSSCCTPAATSRWPRSAAWCGWTSRATSGRSSSRRPRISSCCTAIDIHEMQPYRPLPDPDRRADRAGADDHRRARLLVPARHGGHELPPRAREDLGRRGCDRPRGRAASLLPQRRSVRARRRGLPGGLPHRPAVLRRRAAPVHRAGPLRRSAARCAARSCAPGRGRAPRADTSPSDPPRTRSNASARR